MKVGDRVSLQGIFVGSRSMFEAMNRAIAASGLMPVVDRVFPFAEAVEAPPTHPGSDLPGRPPPTALTLQLRRIASGSVRRKRPHRREGGSGKAEARAACGQRGETS